MSNSYRLRSHPNKLLVRHLEDVASSSKKIFKDISGRLSVGTILLDLERCAYIIGASHDIGKGTSFFQNYLSDRNIAFDPLLKSHSIISSHYTSWVIINGNQISESNRDFLAVAASLAIQGHHGSLKSPIQYLTRLYDFVKNKDIMSKQINAFESLDEVERITSNMGLQSFVEFSKKWENHYDSFKQIIRKLSRSIINRTNNDLQRPYFIVNLLYSILLDADRMDAANLSPPERIQIDPCTVTNFVQSKFNTSSLFKENRSDNINISKFRNILFDYVNQKAVSYHLNDKKNIFTLTAPTGLGKTIASLNFAVKLRSRIYSKRNFMPRIIYVAPFITILDQNIEVLKEVFHDKGQSNLLLLHHHLSPLTYSRNVEDDLLRQEGYSTSQSELLIQGWNAEIIVTTFVQFFYTIFGRHTSQLRRLDNLIGSIIILDEVQSIPFEYWGTVRSILRFLSEEFNMIIIMMTATQPLIFSREDTLEVASTEEMNHVPQRVSFCTKTKEAISLPKFGEEAIKIIKDNSIKSLLLELNTIQNSVQIYKDIHDRISKSSFPSRPLFFLSSQVIPLHRRPRIFQIREKLRQMQPLVLVSTQVIEAGVDLDFDIVIRDIGPIDSIIQTAGRCNRNGTKRASDSQVFLYRIIDDENYEFAKRVYGSISIDIANSLLRDKITSIDELLIHYYEETKRRRSSEVSDIINDAISRLNYEKVEQYFNLIEKNYKEPVFVEFDEKAKLIWRDYVQLKETLKPSRNHLLQLRREMEQYMIGISPDDVQRKELVALHGVYKIPFDRITDSYDDLIGFIR